MKGLMMDYPLTLSHFFERSRRLFAKKGLATRVPGAPLFRYTYAEFADRTGRLAGALAGLGIGKGERVGTLAWNSHRHLELYWAAPLSGAVLHTVNIRLSPRDLTYIINHAGDAVLFVDASLWAVLEPIRRELTSVRHYVVMPDQSGTPLPAGPGVVEYEALLREARPLTSWPRLDENDAAGMCYTSGTTGHPKGVVYSHRAIFLHSMAVAMADTLALSERDVILHIVPMFHANAWCVPFAGVMVGATQIFGGPSPQPRDIAEIVQAEKVTFVGAVPTVWIAVKDLVEKEAFDLSSIRCIPIGGSAAPRSLLEAYDKKFGVAMTHAWGMTEMTPVGTVSRLKSYMESWPDEQRYAVRAKQGYAVAGVDLRVVDDQGREVPWDGRTMGELQVRGPWVVKAYHDNPEGARQFTADGWFRTGDVVTLDPEGYIQITDRTKDLIKSGGEWISSIDMESLIMAHPKVLEAAVIAVPHPKWVERPLACVVPKPEYRGAVAAAEILEFLRPQVAKWALPDDIVFLEALPKTSVGKFDKKVLREQFKGRPPTA
ncbi:MAG TPA: long-chain fatty acid--CoA ligase [Methylomirabilota bacterium]|jgi:fatty-acyl-CoA synthase|nr:long-chain fatty acid--CoA ligase [Methylomirabilota bacterium]